jgi:hypothetical protein
LHPEGRFLSIVDKVRAMIPLKEKAEIRVEYGDENFFPSLYHSGAGISPVLLTRPTTTCKARDRRIQQVAGGSQLLLLR